MKLKDTARVNRLELIDGLECYIDSLLTGYPLVNESERVILAINQHRLSALRKREGAVLARYYRRYPHMNPPLIRPAFVGPIAPVSTDSDDSDIPF